MECPCSIFDEETRLGCPDVVFENKTRGFIQSTEWSLSVVASFFKAAAHLFSKP
jgi:hypothetical protein